MFLDDVFCHNRRNKKYNDIKITITRRPIHTKYEKFIGEILKQQASICPMCGTFNENHNLIKSTVNIFGVTIKHSLNGECEKCQTEWEVSYKD